MSGFIFNSRIWEEVDKESYEENPENVAKEIIEKINGEEE